MNKYNVEVTLVNKVSYEVVTFKFNLKALHMAHAVDQVYKQEDVYAYAAGKGFSIHDMEVHKDDDKN